MISKPMHLHYKSSFTVYQPHEVGSPSQNLLDDVLDALYNFVQINTPMRISRRAFASHGIAATDDRRCKLSIASLERGKGSIDPVLWALELVQHDVENPKRTWITNIGIQQEREENLTLSYALWYIDNLGGQLSFAKPPVRGAPELVRNLMSDNRFCCCSGGYIIPTFPIELLPENLQICLDMINDPDRRHPIIIVGCPDVIQPYGLNSRLLGNAILFYAVEIEPLLTLNSLLPIDMQMELDGIRVFLPNDPTIANQHHPLFHIQNIMETGGKYIVAYLAQAYSENFRPDEWRSFPTVDQILKMRNDIKIAELEALRAKQAKTIANQKTTIAKLSDANSCINKALPQEELLDMCLSENDALMKGIGGIIQRIYEEPKFVPSEDDGSVLYQLEKAIEVVSRRRSAFTA